MPSKKARNANGRSSIYYSETDGYWHGRVSMGVRDDGKPDRRHVRSKVKQRVVDKVGQLEKERESGKVSKPGRSWTVEQWLTYWVESVAAPTVRPNTLTGYRAAVYNHLVPGIGAHRIDKLTPEHLERFYTKLGQKRTKDGKQFKPARVHHVHRTVRAALSEAVRRQHIGTNPAKIARPPRVPEEEIVPFTQDEATRLLKAATSVRNGARYVIALTLGLRKGEALGLQWHDIDLEQQTMTIARTVQRLNWEHGCTAAEPCGHRYAGHCPHRYGGGAVAAEVKSRAGRRVVGIPSPLVQVLDRHRREQEQEREKAGNMWREEGWVFTNRLGGPLHPRVDHDTWKELLSQADVRDARLHDARHTAATMLLLLGVPSRAVMDVMGWSEASMTKRYQHVTPEVTSSIAERVGELFWPSETSSQEGEEDDGPQAS